MILNVSLVVLQCNHSEDVYCLRVVDDNQSTVAVMHGWHSFSLPSLQSVTVFSKTASVGSRIIATKMQTNSSLNTCLYFYAKTRNSDREILIGRIPFSENFMRSRTLIMQDSTMQAGTDSLFMLAERQISKAPCNPLVNVYEDMRRVYTRIRADLKDKKEHSQPSSFESCAFEEAMKFYG